MKNPCPVLLSCLLLATVAPAASDDLVVYAHVPGLAPSEHYQVRVRSVIRDLTFENLTIAGKTVGSADFFKTNEFVERLVFSPSAISKP